MKILLSAYACEPNRGSESAVGWTWAVELAKKGHDVSVLTRANNQAVIEEELSSNPVSGSLTFIYYDLPLKYSFWKKGNRGIYRYYLLWQWFASSLAKRMHATACYDLVHHVSFVTVRQPSFMGRLGIPFILGPLAGGESAPWRLRFEMGVNGFLRDALRDVANKLVMFDPFMHYSFMCAEKIYVTSLETKSVVPSCYHYKTEVELAIGIESENKQCYVEKPRLTKSNIKVLYVGQFKPLKGMHLGIKAFAKFTESFPNAQLTIIGSGEQKAIWQDIANSLKLENNISWVPWMSHTDLPKQYLEHDIFLFPSLRDSGGMVVLEALSCGLPVVCLNIGGPGVIVDTSCGSVIDTVDCSNDRVINALYEGMSQIVQDPDKYSLGAYNRSLVFRFTSKINKIYSTDK